MKTSYSGMSLVRAETSKPVLLRCPHKAGAHNKSSSCSVSPTLQRSRPKVIETSVEILGEAPEELQRNKRRVFHPLWCICLDAYSIPIRVLECILEESDHERPRSLGSRSRGPQLSDRKTSVAALIIVLFAPKER